MDGMSLKIPFSDDVARYTKEHSRTRSPDAMAMIFLLAELTNAEPDAVRQRYDMLRKECSRVYYGL